MEVSNNYSFKGENERNSNEDLLHDSLIALLVREIGVDGSNRRELTFRQKLKVFIKSFAVNLTVDRDKRGFLLFLWFTAIISLFAFVVSFKMGIEMIYIMSAVIMIPLVFIVFLVHLTHFCLFFERINGFNNGGVVKMVYTGNPLMKSLGIDWYASLSSQKKNIREAFYYMSLVLNRIGYKYNYESLLRNMENESSSFFERKMILDLFNNYIDIILKSLKAGSPNYYLVKEDWELLDNRKSEINDALSQERVIRFMELLRSNVKN